MRVTSGPPVARKLLTLASTIAVTGLFLAACSSGASSNSLTSSTGSTSSTSSSPNGTGNQGGSSTTSGGSTAASKLSALETNVQSARGGTFKLTYAEMSSSSSAGGTLTFEQMPPKYRFSVGGATAADIVNTGTKTYVCSGSSGHTYCYGYSSSANPFATLLNLITGASVLTQFHKLQSGLAAKLQGVQVNFSNQTFAGQASQCASGTYQGNSFKYCLTNSGVLAYAGGSEAKSFGSISLTSYSTSVSASDFALPAGATIVGG